METPNCCGKRRREEERERERYMQTDMVVVVDPFSPTVGRAVDDASNHFFVAHVYSCNMPTATNLSSYALLPHRHCSCLWYHTTILLRWSKCSQYYYMRRLHLLSLVEFHNFPQNIEAALSKHPWKAFMVAHYTLSQQTPSSGRLNPFRYTTRAFSTLYFVVLFVPSVAWAVKT